MSDKNLVYFCAKCKKTGIQHERFCKNCKELGNGKVETYFKCPTCQHSMRYSNVWKHQKFACWTQTPQNPPQYHSPSPSIQTPLPPFTEHEYDNNRVQAASPLILTPNATLPQVMQDQIYSPFNIKKRKELATDGIDQAVIEEFNNRLSTIDQLTNPLYGDYLYDLLEKEIVEPITGDPAKFYMNRILNRSPQDIQGWIEEILRKRPSVMESIRNKIMKDLLTIAPEKANDSCAYQDSESDVCNLSSQ